MRRLTLGLSVGLIGLGLTLRQYSLPRVLQAQLFYFLSQACVLGVNHLIVDYMWYGSNKGHFEPQPAAMGGVWRLFRNPSQSAAVGVVVPDHSAGRSSLPSTGIERMVGPPLVHFNLNGHDSENRRIVKMAASTCARYGSDGHRWRCGS
mmetsp:Transcript_64742/g.130224  ORF Transcript_64742/g.130224 Transcript_64742/m.130224 type:complete len:149 (+) Transcript_64742:663-1109(+)